MNIEHNHEKVIYDSFWKLKIILKFTVTRNKTVTRKLRSSTELCILGVSSQFDDQYPPKFSTPDPRNPNVEEGNYTGIAH